MDLNKKSIIIPFLLLIIFFPIHRSGALDETVNVSAEVPEQPRGGPAFMPSGGKTIASPSDPEVKSDIPDILTYIDAVGESLAEEISRPSSGINIKPVGGNVEDLKESNAPIDDYIYDENISRIILDTRLLPIKMGFGYRFLDILYAILAYVLTKMLQFLDKVISAYFPSL